MGMLSLCYRFTHRSITTQDDESSSDGGAGGDESSSLNCCDSDERGGMLDSGEECSDSDDGFVGAVAVAIAQPAVFHWTPLRDQRLDQLAGKYALNFTNVVAELEREFGYTEGNNSSNLTEKMARERYGMMVRRELEGGLGGGARNIWTAKEQAAAKEDAKQWWMRKLKAGAGNGAVLSVESSTISSVDEIVDDSAIVDASTLLEHIVPSASRRGGAMTRAGPPNLSAPVAGGGGVLLGTGPVLSTTSPPTDEEFTFACVKEVESFQRAVKKNPFQKEVMGQKYVAGNKLEELD